VKNRRSLLTAFAVAAIGAGVCACTPTTSASGSHKSSGSAASAQTAGGAGTLDGTAASFADSTGTGRFILHGMPAGTVTLSGGQGGQVTAKMNVFGLTPGSSHDVSIDGASGVVHFGVLTANSAGQGVATLTATDQAGQLPAAGRFVVRLGSGGGAGTLAAEPIATSGVLPRHLKGAEEFTFHAVGGDARPFGRASFSYNATAQTLTVTVSAWGLTPGAHAAHIHVGSCLSQGPVAHPLADFVADADGAIVGQTRVVSGVTSAPAPGTWYLNLHLGDMNQILDANGAPTLYFRPMLCTDITSIAATGAAPTGSPSATPTTPATGAATPTTSPAGSPSATPTTPASGTATPSPSSTTPNPVPTHW
jgi:hypothetical protein